MPITLRSGLAGNAIQTQAFPVGLDPTKTFLVDQNGNPCFLSGENAGNLVYISKADIEQYLADRSGRGFNGIIVTAANLNVANFNGDVPYSGSPIYANPNEPYWQYFDYIVERCRVWGITVMLNPWFVGLDDASGDHSVFYNSSTTIIQALGTFFGNRYKNNRNIIWALGGDADPNNAPSYVALNTFAVALRAADPGHLISFEAARVLEAGGGAPNGGYSTVDACTIAFGSTPSWVDFNWGYQTNTTAGSGAQRVSQQGLVCLFGEGYYAGEHSMTALTLRQQNYSGIMGGFTTGLLTGNSLIYPFATGWQAQLGSVGCVQQQILQKLLRSRRHQLLVPDIAGSVLTASTGGFCGRDSEGKNIIAYLPSSQDFTIDRTKIVDAGGQIKCWFVDPTNGVATLIGSSPNTGTQTFTTPGNNGAGDTDWAFVADSNAAGFGAPGT